MKIAFAFASRSRPKKFFETLDTIFKLCKTDVYINCALDLDDESMNNDNVINQIREYANKVNINWGLSRNKVHAINRSAENLPECSIVICQSDDMKWIESGFDEQIINDCSTYAPDTDIFLHYYDGRQKNTSTLNIVGKKYFDRTGYIYNPEYISVYSDNEETEKSRLLGKYKFIDKVMFEHHHPIHQKAVWDEQYRKTEHPLNYVKDRETYLRRKANNFGV